MFLVTGNMNMFTRLGVVTFLAAFLLATPLQAHEGHQDDMSDAEIVAMEAGMAMPDEMAMPDGAHGMAAGEAMAAGEGATAQALSPEELMRQKAVENRLTSVGDLLARLHPVAVHFPIALLLAAALAEFALMIRPTLGLQTTIRFLVGGGALGAVAAALLGWFAGGWRLTDQSDNLFIHRWTGTTLVVLSLLAWWAAAPGKSRGWLRILLAIIAIGLVVQGYFGGEMVNGPNHLGIF